MKKKLLLCLLLCMAMMLLPACGSSKSSSEDAEEEEFEDDDEEEEEEKKSSKKKKKKDDADEEEEEESSKKEDEGVVGKWEVNLDLSGLIEEEMGDMDGLDYSGIPLAVNVYMEFVEDGTYSMMFQKDEFKDAFTGWLYEVDDRLADYLYQSLEDEHGLSKSEADELFEQEFGMGIAEYVHDTMEQELNADDMFDEIEFNSEGTYEIDGDKLYLYTFDEDGEPDTDDYDTIEIKGDKLVGILPDFSDYEMTFTRVS